MHVLWHHIGITWSGVLGVIIATVVLYAAFVAILHFWGTRYLVAGSAISTGVFTAIGALSARAMLGDSPTLFGAAVALATLFLLEAAFWRVHRGLGQRNGRVPRARAQALMINGAVQAGALTRVGLTEERLHERSWAGGVRSLADVSIAIMESRGTLTIVRRGERIDPELLADVAGLENWVPEAQ